MRAPRRDQTVNHRIFEPRENRQDIIITRNAVDYADTSGLVVARARLTEAQKDEDRRTDGGQRAVGARSREGGQILVLLPGRNGGWTSCINTIECVVKAHALVRHVLFIYTAGQFVFGANWAL